MLKATFWNLSQSTQQLDKVLLSFRKSHISTDWTIYTVWTHKALKTHAKMFQPSQLTALNRPIDSKPCTTYNQGPNIHMSGIATLAPQTELHITLQHIMGYVDMQERI